MEISGANAIILHMVEKEQCTVKRILSHRQHTDGSVAPTRGYFSKQRTPSATKRRLLIPVRSDTSKILPTVLLVAEGRLGWTHHV